MDACHHGVTHEYERDLMCCKGAAKSQSDIFWDWAGPVPDFTKMQTALVFERGKTSVTPLNLAGWKCFNMLGGETQTNISEEGVTSVWRLTALEETGSSAAGQTIINTTIINKISPNFTKRNNKGYTPQGVPAS